MLLLHMKKRCYFCKGILSKEKIRHFHQWGEKVVLFEDLEVEKCTQCGEVFLDPPTLERIDAKAKEIFARNAARRNITIPVVAASE